MKLEAKGRNPNLTGTAVPHQRAELETTLALDAIEYAAEHLLALADTKNLGKKATTAALESLVALRDMVRTGRATFDKIDLVLDIAEKRLTQLE